MDALRAFPTDADTIETAQGKASLQKRDIFRNVMWYSYPGSTKQYPMTVERVLEIKALNKEGIHPEELGAAEIEKRGHKSDSEADKGFVNDVGQISLKALERNSRNRKRKADSKADGRKTEGNAAAADNLSRPHRQPKGQSSQKQARGPKPEGGPQRQPKQGGAQQEKPKQQQNQPRKEGEGQKREGSRPPRNRRRGDKPSDPGEAPSA
jgi:hypothetical protein